MGVIDDSIAAIDANDATAIVSGCGSQLIVGYLYCRAREGEIISQSISLHAPPADCPAETCAYYTILFPNGEPSLEGAFKKGETEVKLSWRDLVKKDRFSVNDRGFWTVLIHWEWQDKNKRRQETYEEADIRLRVYPKNYSPLHEAENHPLFAWEWVQDQMRAKVTTKGRAYTGKIK